MSINSIFCKIYQSVFNHFYLPFTILFAIIKTDFLKRITQYNDNDGIINFDNRLYEFYNRALTDLDSLNLKPFTINEVNNFISNSSLLNDFCSSGTTMLSVSLLPLV